MANIPLNYDVATDEVSSFKNFGNFTNNIDSFGNVQLVFSVAQSVNGNVNYVKVPLKTFVYNENKIVDANTTEFTELQTVQQEEKRNVDEVLTQYNNLLEENRILNQTVNDLVEKYENNDDKQVINALKTTIINLRIELGQGAVPSDFSDDCPFLPLV
jgi:predicted P-loop ATPase/GTPase